MEGLLAVVGLEVTTEGVRTGTGTERWRERVPDVSGYKAEAASSVGESEGTSGMTGMQG